MTRGPGGFMAEPATAFGRNLRRERLRHDWTQLELATRAGMSITTLSHMEVGASPKNRPRQATLDRLTTALECTEHALLRKDNPDEPRWVPSNGIMIQAER